MMQSYIIKVVVHQVLGKWVLSDYDFDLLYVSLSDGYFQLRRLELDPDAVNQALGRCGYSVKRVCIDRLDFVFDWMNLFGTQPSVVKVVVDGVRLQVEKASSGPPHWSSASPPDDRSMDLPGGLGMGILEALLRACLARSTVECRSIVLDGPSDAQLSAHSAMVTMDNQDMQLSSQLHIGGVSVSKAGQCLASLSGIVAQIGMGIEYRAVEVEVISIVVHGADLHSYALSAHPDSASRPSSWPEFADWSLSLRVANCKIVTKDMEAVVLDTHAWLGASSLFMDMQQLFVHSNGLQAHVDGSAQVSLNWATEPWLVCMVSGEPVQITPVAEESPTEPLDFACIDVRGAISTILKSKVNCRLEVYINQLHFKDRLSASGLCLALGNEADVHVDTLRLQGSSALLVVEGVELQVALGDEREQTVPMEVFSSSAHVVEDVLFVEPSRDVEFKATRGPRIGIKCAAGSLTCSPSPQHSNLAPGIKGLDRCGLNFDLCLGPVSVTCGPHRVVMESGRGWLASGKLWGASTSIAYCNHLDHIQGRMETVWVAGCAQSKTIAVRCEGLDSNLPWAVAQQGPSLSSPTLLLGDYDVFVSAYTSALATVWLDEHLTMRCATMRAASVAGKQKLFVLSRVQLGVKDVPNLISMDYARSDSRDATVGKVCVCIPRPKLGFMAGLSKRVLDSLAVASKGVPVVCNLNEPLSTKAVHGSVQEGPREGPWEGSQEGSDSKKYNHFASEPCIQLTMDSNNDLWVEGLDWGGEGPCSGGEGACSGGEGPCSGGEGSCSGEKSADPFVDVPADIIETENIVSLDRTPDEHVNVIRRIASVDHDHFKATPTPPRFPWTEGAGCFVFRLIDGDVELSVEGVAKVSLVNIKLQVAMMRSALACFTVDIERVVGEAASGAVWMSSLGSSRFVSSTLQLADQEGDEYDLNVSLSALDLNLDSGLLHAFSETLEALKLDSTEVSDKRASIYIQSVDISPLRVELSYSEPLMEVHCLDKARLCLPRLSLRGIQGLEGLVRAASQHWIPSIYDPHKIARLIATGVTPVRTVVKLGDGLADLVVLPCKSRQAGKGMLRGTKAGWRSFTENAAGPAVGLAARAGRLLIQNAVRPTIVALWVGGETDGNHRVALRSLPLLVLDGSERLLTAASQNL